MQSQLVGAYGRPSVHVLAILYHATGEHRPNRDFAPPNSLLQAISIWYDKTALLHTYRAAESRGDRGWSRWWRAAQSPPAPVIDGVQEARRHKAKVCRPGSFGGGKAPTGVITVSPSEGGEGRSTYRSGKAMISRYRGDVGHAGGQILLRRKHNAESAARGGCSTGECYRGRGRRYPGGARTTSTFSKCSSTSSAPAAPYRTSENIVNDSRTSSL